MAVLLVVGGLLSQPVTGSAASETIHASGEYVMGENETMTDAKLLARKNAERNAAEQGGVYVESMTEVKAAQVTKDKITAIAAALMKVQGEPKYTTTMLSEGNIRIRADIVAVVDTSNLAGLLKNREKIDDCCGKLKL